MLLPAGIKTCSYNSVLEISSPNNLLNSSEKFCNDLYFTMALFSKGIPPIVLSAFFRILLPLRIIDFILSE